jgi:hypothetical protein
MGAADGRGPRTGLIDFRSERRGRDSMGRLEPDAVIEAYKKDVDRTLIRENLKRSVEERFENLMALQRAAEELRRAGREALRRRS